MQRGGENMSAATTTDMPSLPGYTVSEFETLAGIPRKAGYRLIKLGRVASYTDSEGRKRIHPFEAWAYIRQREQK